MANVAVETVRITRQQALRLVDELGPTETGVLETLRHCHVATLDQLGLVASTAKTGHDRNEVAGRAAASLERKGFVIRHPVSPRGSRKQFAFSLSDAAVAAVTSERPFDRVQQRERRDLRLVNSRFLGHALAVTGVYAAFAACRSEGRLIQWQADSEIISFAAGGSLKRIRPDAYGVWQRADGSKQRFFMEAERHPRRLETSDRILKYFTYWHSGSFILREASKVFPSVLYVTPNADKANTALHAIRWAEIPGWADEYFKPAVTTVGLIRQEGITGTIWYMGTEAFTLADTAPTTCPPMFERRSF